VVYARLKDEKETRFYIDPKTGQVVGATTQGTGSTGWLYHGLHSFDFPWLYRYRRCGQSS